jgi:hypothetical protein
VEEIQREHEQKMLERDAELTHEFARRLIDQPLSAEGFTAVLARNHKEWSESAYLNCVYVYPECQCTSSPLVVRVSLHDQHHNYDHFANIRPDDSGVEQLLTKIRELKRHGKCVQCRFIDYEALVLKQVRVAAAVNDLPALERLGELLHPIEGESLTTYVDRAHSQTEQQFVPVFVPALVLVLRETELLMGRQLSMPEVLNVRDKCFCSMMPVDDANKIEAKRGHRDINPEQVWEQWQEARDQFGGSTTRKLSDSKPPT